MMNRIGYASLVICTFLSTQAFRGETTFADKPNILFILTDDQGYGDLGCYGAKNISTPSIDRLASEGMKFTSFYVHNRCSPTRAAFLTGCQAQRVGLGNVVYRDEKIGIHQDEVLVPERLRSAGYATGMVGKWHLGEWEEFHPLNHGFDSFFGFRYIDDNTKGLYRNRELVEKVKSQTDGVHSPSLLAAGIEFIKANRDKPFFLYYASPLPHTKWIPNKKFVGTSKHGAYGDVIQEIDWQVGELMRTLEELQITNNTLVVFTSDNGPQLNVNGHGSSGPLRDGKWTNFEGGIRVPCIMRWPAKILAGSANHEITSIFDMLPTFCEIADISPPSNRVIDGQSILPYMIGENLKRGLYDQFIVPGASIRVGNWKLLVKRQKPGGNIKPGQGMQGRSPAAAGSLFNLQDDIGETTDLSSKFPDKAKELSQRFKSFMREFDQNKRESGKTSDWQPGSRKAKKSK